MPYIGSRVKRKEDVRLLRGIGKYVGDIHRPGMAHAAILRSTHAHARIIKTDASAALNLPGVVGVLTATDMPGLKTIPMRTGVIPGLERSQQTPIATTKVRYVGDPVAVVVAEDRYIAEDALELIEVQYAPLGAVTDARAGMQPGAPQLHEATANNIAANFQVDVGNVDGAFHESDLIVEEEFSTQRHSAVPLENRGLVAEWDEGRGLLTMWGPTKMTHTNWRILSELIGLPQSSIHFIEPEVGGGFGARGEFYPEDFLIPFAARHFRGPICWIEDR
ncbi:MAG TPA: molybdopterin cofactor-binding domain-containing protein, partial [Candidatus Binatia bacterium]